MLNYFFLATLVIFVSNNIMGGGTLIHDWPMIFSLKTEIEIITDFPAYSDTLRT